MIYGNSSSYVTQMDFNLVTDYHKYKKEIIKNNNSISIKCRGYKLNYNMYEGLHIQLPSRLED